MKAINRRSVFGLGGIAAAATALVPFFSLADAAGVPNYGPNEGKDIGAGRRLIEVGVQESQITAYKSLKIIDIIYPVGAADPDDDPPMDMDMVCHVIAGDFRIQKTGIPPYIVKEGGIYTCGIGKKDKATNISNVVGIHRIALLVPA
jgi:hypothetical protein